MKRNIFSFCIIASVLLIGVSAVPLVNSYVVEKDISKSFDDGQALLANNADHSH